MKAKPKQKPVTLGELRDLWIEYMKLKGRSRAEVEKANSTFNRALAFLGGPERDATTMRAIDFERYQAHLQTLRPKTRGGARLAPKTVNWKQECGSATWCLCGGRRSIFTGAPSACRRTRLSSESGWWSRCRMRQSKH